MDNFFGVDSQVAETLHIMSSGWIYGFFIIGACLLAASWLVGWQLRRIERIVARAKAETGEQGPGGGVTSESPKV